MATKKNKAAEKVKRGPTERIEQGDWDAVVEQADDLLYAIKEAPLDKGMPARKAVSGLLSNLAKARRSIEYITKVLDSPASGKKREKIEASIARYEERVEKLKQKLG